MKICWDNLNGIRLTRNGVFIKNNSSSYIYKDKCAKCGEPYLTCKTLQSDFCGRSCALSGSGHPFYNKHLSDAHKKKLSIAFTGKSNHFYGKKHSERTKRILRKKQLGKKIPVESMRKRAKAQRGVKIHSEEYKKYLSKKFSGRNNPAWKGGISKEPYCQDWTKDLKEYIKYRDSYRCMNPYCFKKSDKLVVHHINYNKKVCGPQNLVTVCNSCNSMANYDRDWHQKWYQTILNKRYGYSYE